MSDTPNPNDPPGLSQLAWVHGLLTAGDPDARLVRGDRPPPGYRVSSRFLMLPGSTSPYILLPLGDRRATANSLGQVGNPLKRSYRLAERAFSMGLRWNMAQPLLARQRVSVCVPIHAADRPSLEGTLAEHLEIPDVQVAIILGRNRPNRKPVLRVMDRHGRPVAFAKVGWNDVSRRLVRHEVEVLRTLGDATMTSFRIPRLLGSHRVGDLELVFVTPVPDGSALRDGPPVEAPLAATRELATVSGTHAAALTDDPYWARLRDRTRVATARPDNPNRRIQIATLESVEQRYGNGREVVFGRWHGDWTPWNMTSVNGTLWIWDWERSEPDVPVGLDLAHFDFDVRVKVKGQTPRDAGVASMLSLAPAFERLGIASGSSHLLTSLHLLEMSLRFEEARALGHRVNDDVYAPALETMRRDPAMSA